MKPEFLIVKQGSPEWLSMRLGVITASPIYDLLPSKKGGGFKQARDTYMNELIGEVCTGHAEELNAKALEWGHLNEPAARAEYEFRKKVSTLEGGFVYGLDRRVGCSPDFRIDGAKKGGEIKCPMTPKVHIDSLLNNEVKEEYIAQIQFSMWVSGFEAWDFVSYHPRMKSNMLHVQTFERDPKMMNLFDEIIPQFIKDMDAKLEKLGVKWADQWK